MSNNNAVGSRFLHRMFFAVLFAVSGLASCGSGGTTTTTTTTITPALSVSLVPSRTSGVAPLAVFFDATGTASAGVTSRPFHDLEYRWDFEDTTSGNWLYGAQPGTSKNTATGPVAAHIFESPGDYTVTLTAFDGTNTNATTTKITVTDPNTVFAGENTICIRATTSPTPAQGECPAGALAVVQPSFPAAISSYALTGKRVLFKRGDVFAAATSASLTMNGPGIVGAYGTITDPKPIVQMTGDTTILNLSSAATPAIKDWRIMDLEFDGLSKNASLGIDTQGTIKQILVLNMDIHDIRDGIKFNGSMLEYLVANGYPAHTMYDEMAIVNSIITPITGSTVGWRIFASAKRLSILGNELGDMVNTAGSGSHVIRTPYIGKGVIANNTVARSYAQLALKLHGPAWCHVDSLAGECLTWDNVTPPPDYTYLTTTHPIGVYAAPNGYTEQVIVSDNKFIGASSPYLVVIGPQNEDRDERIRDVIVERNWFKAGNNLTRTALVIHSYETTVRNNICDMSAGASTAICFNPALYGAAGPARPPDHIRIYNNTAYKSDAGSEFNLARIDTTSTNVTVQNNLAYAPLSGSTIMVSGTGASGLVQSNNSDNDQMKSTPPGWVSATTPSSPADFGLTAGSYGLSAGTTVKVFSDFFRNPRPQSGGYDMGAIEGP